MRARCVVFTICAGLCLLLSAGSAVAHHSITAEFDASEVFTVRGTVTGMEWINPHSWLHVSVKRPNGATEEWEVELGPSNSLLRRGWTKQLTPVGVEVIVSGFRARDRKVLRMVGRDITLSDGRKVFESPPIAGGKR
jgi:Family of unknown function (DUF6152)